MSFAGIAAAGLGGGANAVGSITAGYIDQDRRLESAQVLADIDTQRQMRLTEYNAKVGRQSAQDVRADALAFDTANVDARNDIAKKTGIAAGATARAVKIADLSDPTLPALERKKADEDAAAATTRDATKTKSLAGDKEYMAAVGAIKLADPQVAAQIAASRASAASSYASAAESGERAKGVKLANADKVKLDGLYDEATRILSDATLDDTKRAAELAKVERQIVMMKSKTGQAAARDPELDTQTVTEEKMNPDGTITKVVRKEVRRPGATAAPPATPGAPPVGAEVDGFRFKGGNPRDKASWEPVGATKPKGIAAAPTPEPTPYVPPADSPVGKARARNDAIAAERQAAAAAQNQAALEAAAALPPGDRRAAAKFQAGPMFSLLPIDQQRAISALVNGR